MGLLLEVRSLVKRFGPTVALDGAELSLEAGEILGLVGANGSGKSTLIRVVAGLVRPDGGQVRWQGKAFLPSNPLAAWRAGIAVAHQETSLIPTLSLWENLTLPHRSLGKPLPAKARVRELLDRLTLAVPLEVQAGQLSASERQIAEVAKALLWEPRLLLLDEPTAALDHEQVQALFTQIRAFAARGTGCIFVSHRLSEVRSLCHRILVLRGGRVVYEANSKTPFEELLARMVEGFGAGVRSTLPVSTGEELLRVEGLRTKGVHDVSLVVRQGEVVGLGGLQGQGQRELLMALAGALPAQGRIWLGGRPLPPLRPAEALRMGLALVSGDRQEMAFLPRSVAENLLIAAWPRFARGGGAWLDLHRARQEAFRMADGLGLVYAGLDAPLSGLSGGNQQKVFLGRALLAHPLVLLLDDPTVGVDPPTRAAFYARVQELAGQGLGILLYSSDEEEILRHAHRVLVLLRGRVVAVLEGVTLTREALLAASLGVGRENRG
ncbi:sugar ABC transporter [Thermus sp. LT1-2-5]|uniref:sugar ABC transporter ATP-binding protein n=1 Tax=Thermus sp. LT1-2-5 TaxID=3026935 RepID=UPI0030E93164